MESSRYLTVYRAHRLIIARHRINSNNDQTKQGIPCCSVLSTKQPATVLGKNMTENKWSSYEISGIRARKRGQERSRKTEVRRTKKRQEEFNLDEFLGTYYPRRGLEAHGTSLGVVPNVSRRHDGTRGSHVDFLPVANSVLDVERVATTRIGPIARFHGPFRVTAGA